MARDYTAEYRRRQQLAHERGFRTAYEERVARFVTKKPTATTQEIRGKHRKEKPVSKPRRRTVLREVKQKISPTGLVRQGTLVQAWAAIAKDRITVSRTPTSGSDPHTGLELDISQDFDVFSFEFSLQDNQLREQLEELNIELPASAHIGWWHDTDSKPGGKVLRACEGFVRLNYTNLPHSSLGEQVFQYRVWDQQEWRHHLLSTKHQWYERNK